ncbi:hypothetical protein EV356DRAFT_580358 [Viridothelium virens]|uniref:Uncharacterized protein n=1 Tax=Viridothelium virens TaxID=1048519 RepID=A0A6A6GWM0_VIRVR|nr:hypothetical protein EV356DRAFT_580358 [Viridothelium virens]
MPSATLVQIPIQAFVEVSTENNLPIGSLGSDQLELGSRVLRTPLSSEPSSPSLHLSSLIGVKKFFLVFLLNCSRNGSRGIQEGTPSLQSIWTLTPASRSPSVSSRPRIGVTLSQKPPRKKQKSGFLLRLRASDGKVTKLDTPLFKPSNPVVEEIAASKRTYASTKKIVILVVARPVVKTAVKTSTSTKKLAILESTTTTTTATTVITTTTIAATRKTYREPYRRYAEAQIDVEDREYDRERGHRSTHRPGVHFAESELDITERDYRQRSRPAPVAEAYPERDYPETREEVRVEETRTTVDPPHHHHRSDMGYYDEDGHYHSFRHGLQRATDRVLHPSRPHHHHHHHRYDHNDREEDIVVDRVERTERIVEPEMPRYSERYSSERVHPPNTITIPCHHIRIGDLVILQGRPCQVIRITTSAQTGQHRYLGVDLFTKQLHEESSFVSNPSPSVIVQNMLGPVFKQYRVLDIRDDGRVVAMTETGDVKQGLPVIDQSGLHHRLRDSFDNGRGSVRVLVINDEGRELAVDYKVVHGSRL